MDTASPSAAAQNMQGHPSTIPQIKRVQDIETGPNAKRRKSDAPSTPGLMGPPGSIQKRKDEGLDDGDPNDMFGSAGINLQDEERNMSTFEVPRTVTNTQSSAYVGLSSGQSDRVRQSDFLEAPALRHMISQHLSSNGLARMEPDIHGLLGLALKERMTGLVSRMSILAKHRAAPPPTQGRQINDVGDTLRAISLKEIQEEDKRRSIALIKRQELENRKREEESTGKKKESSASKSKGLSDTAIARNANATAQLMLNTSGGKQYSWMTSSAGTGPSLPRRTVSTNSPTATIANSKPGANVFKAGSIEERGIIGMKDFIGALELEGQDVFGRGGRTLLKAYTRLKD